MARCVGAHIAPVCVAGPRRARSSCVRCERARRSPPRAPAERARASAALRSWTPRLLCSTSSSRSRRPGERALGARRHAAWRPGRLLWVLIAREPLYCCPLPAAPHGVAKRRARIVPQGPLLPARRRRGCPPRRKAPAPTLALTSHPTHVRCRLDGEEYEETTEELEAFLGNYEADLRERHTKVAEFARQVRPAPGPAARGARGCARIPCWEAPLQTALRFERPAASSHVCNSVCARAEWGEPAVLLESRRANLPATRLLAPHSIAGQQQAP